MKQRQHPKHLGAKGAYEATGEQRPTRPGLIHCRSYLAEGSTVGLEIDEIILERFDGTSKQQPLELKAKVLSHHFKKSGQSAVGSRQ